MKKRLIAIALSCSIALTAAFALAAQENAQTGCGKCNKVAQNTEKKCTCPACAEGKKDAECACGCNSSKGCDMKACDSCAKKQKSQQKGCCDQ